MATEVVNLDEILPNDLEFIYQGSTYVIPGDLPTDGVLALFNLYRELLDARDKLDAASSAKGSKAEQDRKRQAFAKAAEGAYDNVRAHLLELFRIRQPHLETLPFGAQSLPVIVQHLLGLLNVNTEPDAEGNSTSPDSTTSPKRSSKPSGRRKAGSRSATARKG